MKSLPLFALMFSLALLSAPATQAENEKELAKDVETATAAFTNRDSSMKALFKNAAGYVVFPNVGKGGFVIGGAHGNGLVYEAGKLVGRASLTQVTVGAQIGGQEFSEVIFFENKDALARFKASKMEMSAQVGAMVAADGVAEHAKYVNGVMIFTQPKSGLMAEASVGGQKFKFEPIKK